MKRIAMIRNGIVESVASWDGDSEWNPDSSFQLVDVTDINCGPGFLYDGINFSEPLEEPMPE